MTKNAASNFVYADVCIVRGVASGSMPRRVSVVLLRYCQNAPHQNDAFFFFFFFCARRTVSALLIPHSLARWGSRIRDPESVPLWHEDYLELVILKKTVDPGEAVKTRWQGPFVRDFCIRKGNLHLQGRVSPSPNPEEEEDLIARN